MKAALKAICVLPVCAIGLLTVLWPPSHATAAPLAFKNPAQTKVKDPPKVKVPPQAGAKSKDAKPKDKHGDLKANRFDDHTVGLGVEVGESETGLPSSATVVIPGGPAATVQLPATSAPAAPTPETASGTTGPSQSEPRTEATVPVTRPSTARPKRRRQTAAAKSTPRPLSSPLGIAASAPVVGDGNTASRTVQRREPKQSSRVKRSVVRRIVDRVPTAYRLGLLAAIALAGGFALATIRQGRRARHAEAEALVDPLTGLANRRAFDRRLEEEWKRSDRYGRPLGLVMLDLDGFKQLNDTRGHKEGDRVLRETAALIADRLREIDMAARLGGDEFAALCPETPSEGLDALTHSLGETLQGLAVGVSIGYASREPTDEEPLDLLARADAAMYRNKRAETVRS